VKKMLLPFLLTKTKVLILFLYFYSYILYFFYFLIIFIIKTDNFSSNASGTPSQGKRVAKDKDPKGKAKDNKTDAV
jgi:hypothetical protein